MLDGKLRNLKEIKKLNKNQFKDWLYFGPHGLNKETPPHLQSPNEQKKCFKKIINEINRFAGSKNYSSFIRLHHYSESFELYNFFKKNNIKALFSTDRNVGSHRMPNKISQELITKGYAEFKKLQFIRTDFRIEWLVDKRKKKY